MIRRVGLTFALGVVVLCAAPPGAPVQLSYVYSDSMEPTIGVNDGYVLVPANDVAVGDIVTFRSPERDAYVTHRVVGRSGDGFVTKGDNNPTTDQRSGYSPVARDEILGEVLTFDGAPVLIPQLGAAIQTVQSHTFELVGGALVLVGLHSARAAGRARRRSVTRVGGLFGPILLVGFVVLTVGFAYGGAAHEVTLVAVSPSVSSSAPNVVPVGAPHPLDVTLRQEARPLLHRVVVADGMAVTERTRNATTVRVRGAVAPPESVGPVRVRVTVSRYPAIVPRGLLVRLQRVHPLAAGGVSVLPVVTLFWLSYRTVVDPRTPLRWRSPSGRSLLRRGPR